MLKLKWQHLSVLILLAVVLLGNLMVAHHILTISGLGMNDFLSRWEGARSYLIDGVSPYGAEASLNIQSRIYGGPAPDGRDPSLFAYPFYTVFLVAPLVVFDYVWAASIWMVILEVLLVSIMIMMLDLLRWRPRPWVFGLLLLGTLLNYASARGLFLGQPSHIVIFAQMLAVWALMKQRDNLAGLALALSTIKPQMGYLFIPFILLWAVWRGRIRIILAFGGAMAVLTLASFVLLPTWLLEWIDAILNYSAYTINSTANHVLLVYYLGLSPAVEAIVNLCLYLLVLWAAFRVIVKGRNELFLWTTALIFTVTNLVVPRHGTSHFAIFVIMLLAFYSYVIVQCFSRRHGWRVTILVALTLTLPWIHFFVTVRGNLEDLSMSIPVPLVAFVVLMSTQRQWLRLPQQVPSPVAATIVGNQGEDAISVMIPDELECQK